MSILTSAARRYVARSKAEQYATHPVVVSHADGTTSVLRHRERALTLGR